MIYTDKKCIDREPCISVKVDEEHLIASCNIIFMICLIGHELNHEDTTYRPVWKSNITSIFVNPKRATQIS